MLINCPKILQNCFSCPTDSLQPHDSLFTVINDQEKQQKFRHSWLQTTEMIYWVTKLWEINPLNRRRSTSERNQVSVVKSFDSDDKMSVTGPGCSFWLRLWKVGLRPSKNPWQNQPPPSRVSLLRLSFTALCGRQPAPGLALPNSGRANQPRASALAPFPVSACRLLALSEGQLSAVRPTLPPANSHKEPSVLGGRGEVRRNRRSIHKNTLLSVRLEAAYRELWQCLVRLVLHWGIPG